jgi:hypothetical protein
VKASRLPLLGTAKQKSTYRLRFLFFVLISLKGRKKREPGSIEAAWGERTIERRMTGEI